ncbi:hypothetical protein [Patulibacter minatonensis]|uniref:hypothetical protein n=1 Tax=Patulibacter minatonensis TaxID=298163 RepID=UPI00047BC4C3|nr:hypothetical protein [Patulibacter minatonensis]
MTGRTAQDPDGRGVPEHRPRAGADVVPVRLHTRRGGELRWQDRGRAFLPRDIVAAGAGSIRYDGVAYELEDVFDDGRTVAVWVRSSRAA